MLKRTLLALFVYITCINPAWANPVYYELNRIAENRLIPEVAALPIDMRLQTLCLAMAIYREARGEPVKDQLAVGRITINRVGYKDFAPTMCEVIYQKTIVHGHTIYQYSWTRNADRHQIKEASAWIAVQKTAYRLLTGAVISNCSLLYFNDSRNLSRKCRVG